MGKLQKIVVTGFLHENGKVLIARRSMDEQFLPGFYELPGGKIDFGEEPTQALKREFMEEVKLKIEVLQPLQTFAYVSEDGNRHTVEIVFMAKLAEQKQQVTLGKDHNDFKWIGKEEIEKFKITNEIKNVIGLGFHGLGRQVF